MLAILLCPVLLPVIPVNAAGMRIYNYNTNTTAAYTGVQVKYTYNGKMMPMQMPGIIIDNIALAAYDDLFENGLGFTCTYNKENGKITIAEGKNTIVMTLGSKKATVNGNSVTLSVAPVKLKFVDEDLEKIYVPTRFVAENLGCVYVWTKSTSTATVTRTLHFDIGNDSFDYNGTFYSMSYAGETISSADFRYFLTTELLWQGAVRYLKLQDVPILKQKTGCL